MRATDTIKNNSSLSAHFCFPLDQRTNRWFKARGIDFRRFAQRRIHTDTWKNASQRPLSSPKASALLIWAKKCERKTANAGTVPLKCTVMRADFHPESWNWLRKTWFSVMGLIFLTFYIRRIIRFKTFKMSKTKTLYIFIYSLFTCIIFFINCHENFKSKYFLMIKFIPF